MQYVIPKPSSLHYFLRLSLKNQMGLAELLDRDIRAKFFAAAASANAFNWRCRVVVTTSRQPDMARIN
jgi:hypothetical protein